MKSSHLLAMASVPALLCASPSFAQEGADQPPAPEAADDAAGVIVVTAQLREQAPVQVPIALTAYSGSFLEGLGIDEFDDLSRFVPGFEVQNQSPNNPGFVMRGITSDSGTAFNEPRVSVYQDGVSISKSRGSYVELFDIDRVEIAKGPQSTLYGRGALIGAVNIIQNKAELGRSEGLLRGAYGNRDYYLIEAMGNARIGDHAALRLSGRIKKRDGYVDNLLGGEDYDSTDTQAVRGALKLAPSDALSFDLLGNYQHDAPAGTSFKSLSYSPTDPVTGTVLASRRPWDGAALAPGTGFEGNRPLGLEREVWGVTGIGRAELGEGLTLTEITAYRRFNSLEIFDADGISLPALTAGEEARGKQFSQEARLSFDNHGPFSAFVGATYFHESGSQRVPTQFDERVILARLAGALNGPIPGRAATDPGPLSIFSNTAFTGALLQGVAAASGVSLSGAQAQAIAANLKANHLETSTNFARTNAIDLYGDVTLHLGDRFELGAGLRYSHDDKTSRFTSAVLNGRSILGGFIGALGQPAATRTALLGALAVPGAATIPTSAAYPVPLFGLGAQPTTGNGGIESQDHSDEGFTWRLYARYAPSENSSLYASYSRGRRPEILSALAPSAPLAATRFNIVDAETVDSYEAGAKAELLDHHLYLDAAAFYYRYNNFQTTEQQGTLFVTTNAGKAQAFGFESQLRWIVNANARIFATYGYNHSRFKSGIRDGNHFRLSPDHSLSAGATFSARLGEGRIDFTPAVTWQSKVFFDDDNDRSDLQRPPLALVADTIQDEYQNGYALASARLGYTFNSAPQVRIEAFVDNLFNKKYLKDAGNTGDAIGLPTFIAGEPRFYGAQLSLRF